MKIISGKYKGRNIVGYDINGTRPTMDRVKESLFAMIQNYIDNSNCLDLFAGSGNLGLEALSNGASSCTFIDNNKIAIKTIKNAITNFKNNPFQSMPLFVSSYISHIPLLRTKSVLNF